MGKREQPKRSRGKSLLRRRSEGESYFADGNGFVNRSSSEKDSSLGLVGMDTRLLIQSNREIPIH
jgi:hypothetical protein